MLDIFSLKNKRAIVVGGAGDLGSAIMEGLLEAGAYVVAIDIDNNVHNVAQSFQKKGLKAASLQVDITDRDAIKKSVSDAETLLNGSVEILVNSAGIQRRSPSEIFPEKDWDDVISINLTATFLYCQQVAPNMISNGYGKIINVASIMSFFGGITIPAYAASKGGVAQLTKALSNDWASKGVCVNAIAPGYIDTRLNTALVADFSRSSEVFLRTPMKRWGLSSDMKGAAIFLSSPASDFITGVVLPIDGGYSAR
jgi:2-deoxy-D-gluconate 3-dehydrogenase